MTTDNAKRLIDARGLPCPQPVVLTIRGLEEADEVTTIVDSESAQENVTRLAQNRGYGLTVERKGDGVYLTVKKGGAQPTRELPRVATGTVVFVASEFLGRGENPQLGSLLMQSFMRTLDGLTAKPETIIFMNSGVKLVAADSPVVDDLRRLEGQGIEILACGTCLSRYELMDKVGAGQVSNMHVIADTLLRAEKVIPL